MKAWKDSATPPTDAELEAAKLDGVDGWAGYFKFDSLGNVVVGVSLEPDNIYIGWADSDFQRVQAHGLRTLAFCSGRDNPKWCADRATALKIQPWLDDESGMRIPGGWEQDWVNQAFSGLYGNENVHVGVIAPLGHIYAGYFNYNPMSTWPSWVAKPVGPLGWQWQGTHAQYGVSLDNDWFDDAIGGLFGAASKQLVKPHGRVFTVIMGSKAFQVCRGGADATGKRGLFLRTFEKGVWSAWRLVGGNLAVDDLGEERIDPVVDESGNVSLTVTGSVGDMWDAVSTDGLQTFTWVENKGIGDGLLGVSAGSQGSIDPAVIQQIAAAATGVASVQGALGRIENALTASGKALDQA